MKKVIIALLVVASLFALVSCELFQKDDQTVTFVVKSAVEYTASATPHHFGTSEGGVVVTPNEEGVYVVSVDDLDDTDLFVAIEPTWKGSKDPVSFRWYEDGVAFKDGERTSWEYNEADIDGIFTYYLRKADFTRSIKTVVLEVVTEDALLTFPLSFYALGKVDN